MNDEIDISIIRRTLERERAAREIAENLLEEKSSQLYISSQKLKKELLKLDFLHSLSTLNADTNSFYQFFLNKAGSIFPIEISYVYAKNTHATNDEWEIITQWKKQDLEINFSLEAEIAKELKEHTAQKLENINTISHFPISKQILHFEKTISLMPPSCHFSMIVPIKIENKNVAVMEFIYSGMSSFEDSDQSIISDTSMRLGAILETRHFQEKMKKNYLELKNTQQQLVHSEKMATLGVIAAGVAHEVNNPLCFLISNNETLNSYIKIMQTTLVIYKEIHNSLRNKDIEGYKKYNLSLLEYQKENDLEFVSNDSSVLLEENLFGLNRIKEIVQNLKKFSRVDESEIAEADINDCISLTLKILANELKYKINLKTELNKIPRIVCFQGQIIQVLTNLIINAVHAIKDEGDISIKTFLQAEQICIKITDTGHGIPDDVLQNLFTPFFTTKPSGQGTGLGLSISLGIIQKHNGSIDIESKVNEGTTFTITLPLKNNLSLTANKGDKQKGKA